MPTPVPAPAPNPTTWCLCLAKQALTPSPPPPLARFCCLGAAQTPISTLGVIGSTIAIIGTLLYSLAKSKFG